MNTLAIAFATVSMNLDLPPNLLSAVCYVESNHNINAIHIADGPSDSLGLCQIKLETARQFGFKGNAEELRHNYQKNMFYAGRYLKYQLNRYRGDTRKAVAAYNAGSYRPNKTAAIYFNKVVLAWEGLDDKN